MKPIFQLKEINKLNRHFFEMVIHRWSVYTLCLPTVVCIICNQFFLALSVSQSSSINNKALSILNSFWHWSTAIASLQYFYYLYCTNLSTCLRLLCNSIFLGSKNLIMFARTDVCNFFLYLHIHFVCKIVLIAQVKKNSLIIITDHLTQNKGKFDVISKTSKQFLNDFDWNNQ